MSSEVERLIESGEGVRVMVSVLSLASATIQTHVVQSSVTESLTIGSFWGSS